MKSVREFFLAEAGEALRRLDRVVDAATDFGVDTAALLRQARLIRGSAQMAREERVAAVAQALESFARAVAGDVVAWNADARARVAATARDLRMLVEATASYDDLEARARTALQRLRDPNAPRPSAAASGDGSALGDAFLAYAAREVAGIVRELDRALPVLRREARNREPLKMILRRQRALLGAARIGELPPVAGALRAIDETCRLIARQDVAVEGDWLELFRTARTVLDEASRGLTEGRVPEAPSLPRLEQLRAALLERYGGVREVPRAQVPPGIEPPRNMPDFFRREAGVLLARIERMAADLERASADRQAMLRREIQGALTALRDTALGLGFGRSAIMADSALARVGRSMAAEILDLLPALRETVDTDQPVPTAVARGGEGAPQDAAGRQQGAGPDRPAGAAAPAPEPTPGTRAEALARRAEALRPVLERAVAADPAAKNALHELFDLIRQVTA